MKRTPSTMAQFFGGNDAPLSPIVMNPGIYDGPVKF